MRILLEKSKYLMLIASLFSLVASTVAFIWGGVQTVYFISILVSSFEKETFSIVSLIEIMDIFLVATALFIFSAGMYELSVKEISVPEWLIVHSLHELKSKLASIIILVMAVTFLKHLVEWKDPQGTLFFGIAIAIVSAALIFFSVSGDKD